MSKEGTLTIDNYPIPITLPEELQFSTISDNNKAIYLVVTGRDTTKIKAFMRELVNLLNKGLGGHPEMGHAGSSHLEFCRLGAARPLRQLISMVTRSPKIREHS